MDRWDVALLAVVCYLAVTALVRLMLQRRDKLVARFRRELAVEIQRQKQAEKQRQKQEAAATTAPIKRPA